MRTEQQTSTPSLDLTTRLDSWREQMLRELASSLRDLVESGDMTDIEANEWYNAKADQWSDGQVWG